MMFRGRTIICLIFCVCLIQSCGDQSENHFLRSASFDNDFRLLTIDAHKQQDTVFRKIIHYSGIRQSGYGVLLNFNETFSNNRLDSIRLKFQKLDINAVHDFNIIDTLSPPKNVLVAIENARFCWILSDSKDKTELAILNLEIISALTQSTSNGGIIVADKTQSAKLKQLISS